MSCETVKIRLQDRSQNGNLEITMVSDIGSWKKHYVLALRLYLEGAYDEPPMRILPPTEEMRQNEGCVV